MEEEKKDLETLPPREQGSPVVGFLKKLGWRGLACLTTYFLGYFNFSIAWMITPLILSALRDQYKKEKRQRLAAAREAALTNEQAMIESRMLVDDLPSWVYFPDKERAEWVNNIIKQLWPNVNNYVRKVLFETVEPLVKNILQEYKLAGFKFERENVHLGQIPPRISGIKVYNEKVTSRNEIIMDLDVVFASDLEVMFSIKGISAKVSEFSLRGMLRVVLKPLISDIPLIGGVQVFFLSDPEIDYSLGGVAGALDVPGLSKIVDQIVCEQVRNFVVLPNKIYIPLVASLPKKDLICPNTAGVLRVTLMRAKDLMQKDVGFLGKGKSDPYAVLTVGATTYKTPTIENSCDPTWNLTYDFPVEVVNGQEFMMELYDEDDRKDDEFLGRATVQTAAVADRGEIQGFWVDLEECKSGKAQVSLKWLPVTNDPAVVREIAKKAGEDEHAKCILHVYVDSCTGLQNMKNHSYKPSPLVQITCAKDVRQTWPKANTTSPVMEQGFVMLIKSPDSDDIHIKVLDTNKENRCIGTASVNVWSIIQQPGMEYSLQPWILKGTSPDAKIVMAVSVRGIIQSSTSTSTLPEKDLTPLLESPRLGKQDGANPVLYDETVKPGTIKLVIHKAVELEKKDLGGTSDPYVIISYEDQQFTTRVCKNTIEPIWNHEETIRVKENGDIKITIRVMDKDKIGKDEPLGLTSLDVRRVSHAGAISQVWDILSHCKTGRILLSAEFTPLNTDPPEVVLAAAEDAGTKIPPDVPPTIESTATAEERLAQTIDESAADPVFRPGYLHVTVHSAVDLEAKDFGGKSDPYVMLSYGGNSAKSKTQKKTLNPVFEFTESFAYSVGGSTRVDIQLFDKDLGEDEYLGGVELDVSEVLLGGVALTDHWVDLQGVKKGKILASVNFSETQLDVFETDRRPSENNIIQAAISPAISVVQQRHDIGYTEDEGLRRRMVGTNGRIRITLIYEKSKGELKVFIHEAAGLPGGDLPDPPDPYVKVYLMPGKSKKKKTSVVKDSGNPRFDEEFDFYISFSKLQEHSLKISVVDKKGVFARSPHLGTCTVSLDNPGLVQGVADWFPLHHEDNDSD